MAPCSAPLEDNPSMESSSTQDLSEHAILQESPSKLPLDSQHVQILVELVGACNLSTDMVEALPEDDLLLDGAAAATTELHPYCVVTFGKRKIHTTRKADGCKPIWTLDTQSLFVLETTADELACRPLTISLYSKHQESTLPFPSSCAFLGQVSLDGAKILTHCTEERLEFELSTPNDDDDDANRGSLALRFRIATDSDVKFVKAWNKRMRPNDSTSLAEVVGGKQRKAEAKLESKCLLLQEEDVNGELSPPSQRRSLAELVTEADETEMLSTNFLNSVSSAFLTASTVLDPGKGGKVRVKPGCDRTRPEATTYMTPKQVKAETLKASTQWTEAGSGHVGRLFLEVLSCDDLPNVDVGEAMGNVTDSFVAAVFEDALVQTPVIDDELSPCWMPWTGRAFMFNMMHPASTLYLGVFDYDIGPLSSHDPIGRAAVNISNLQRDTVYTLRYNLYPSANVTDRTPQGTITIRLRIEMNDEKAALMAAFRPRPKMHVNVHKEKSFNVVQYTCYGVHNEEDKFELTVLRSYINEILEYKRRVTYCIHDALTSLIFWRGQVKVYSFMLPIDSLLFFWAAATLVERPYLFPAFLLLSVPWILLANMRLRTQHPSPWNRCPSFWHYLWILKTGKSPPTTRSRRIDAWEGWEEAKAMEDACRKRLEADQKSAEKKVFMQKKLNEIGDDNINTTIAGSVIPIDLLNRLGRYQGIIGGICRKFRFIRTILLWEESIVSFWIAAVFLAAGIVALFLPWAFILRWTGRIVVWGFLGPHMKVVDLVLKARAEDGETHLIEFHKQKTKARIRREEALKLKAVKSLRFGKYITLVPNFNLARHYDRPLPQSTARPWRKSTATSPDPKDAQWIPGQQLYGFMIPRPEKESMRNRELSLKAKERLSLLEARLVALQVAAACGGGIQTLRRRILHLKDSKEEEEPHASGYELIPCVDTMLQDSLQCSSSEIEMPQVDIGVPEIDLSSFAYDGMSLRRVSFAFERQLSTMFPSIYELGAEGPPQAKELEAEEDSSLDDSPRNSSFEDVSPSSSEEPEQEEGIEIIACDHIRTGDHNGSPVIAAVDAVEVVCTTERVCELSTLYRSSESVFVAFYREAPVVQQQ